MPFKFNPITGNLDLVNSQGSSIQELKDEALIGTKNETNKVFTATHAIGIICWNGQKLTEGEDYTKSSLQITMTNAPSEDDILTNSYLE